RQRLVRRRHWRTITARRAPIDSARNIAHDGLAVTILRHVGISHELPLTRNLLGHDGTPCVVILMRECSFRDWRLRRAHGLLLCDGHRREQCYSANQSDTSLQLHGGYLASCGITERTRMTRDQNRSVSSASISSKVR